MNQRQVICKAICKSGRFETGQGTCALLCMDHLGIARRACSHTEQIHGGLADKIIEALDHELAQTLR